MSQYINFYSRDSKEKQKRTTDIQKQLLTMKKPLFLILTIVGTVLLFSCSEQKQLKGFDAETWKKDRKACLSLRKNQEAQAYQIREQLKGWNETQVREALGSPDYQELYTRNQKFFTYFIEPAPECTDQSQNSALRLILRFNAMGLINEVTIARNH
jgi:outer membrane protein assembly factor BamE (lipoprotein component of BamABCDE complex)